MQDCNKIRKYKLNKIEFKCLIKKRKEPIMTQKETDQTLKILDSNYYKANWKTVVKCAKDIKEKEKDLLYQLLSKYEDIFDGTLG